MLSVLVCGRWGREFCGMLDLSIIIVNYNTRELTFQCLNSIFSKKSKVSFEVVLIDNGSTDRIDEVIKKKYPKVIFERSEINTGFTGGNNLGLKKAHQSKYYLLLNSDTQVVDNSLDTFVAAAERNKFGISSCKLIFENRKFQPNAGDLPTLFPVLFWLFGVDDICRKLRILTPSFHQVDSSYYQDGQEVGWVQGAAMLIRDDVYQKIGLLDDQIFMYCEDVDYCWRARQKKFKIGWTDQAEIIHYGGASLDNPRLSQWIGEFKGLLYLYKKNYTFLGAVFLKGAIYLAIVLRMIGFGLLGKKEFVQTYEKVLTSI